MTRRLLSNRIEAIEYVHKQDGLPYRHTFKSGGTISLLKDGSVLVRNRDKKLWDTFDNQGRTQEFLVNPPGGKMAAKRKKKTTRRRRRNPAMSVAQARYFAPKRKRRRNPARAAAPARRRRRRNPSGFSVGGILGRIQRGGIDAACVVGGKLGARLASSQFDYEDGSMMDSLVEVVAAVGLSMVAERVIGSDRARFVMAGGISSAMETMISQANITKISPLLGATPRQVNTSAVFAAADAPGTVGDWSRGGQPLGAWSRRNGNTDLGAPAYTGYPSIANVS